ncbi:hypothetical protein MMC25_006531 [Agyrium rufum]|nr:hypothetical protein [Agyrium rufum]
MVLGAPTHVNKILQSRQQRRQQHEREAEDLRHRRNMEINEFAHRTTLAKKEAAEMLKIEEARHRQQLARNDDLAKARDNSLLHSRELELQLNSKQARESFIVAQHSRDAEREHNRLLGETSLQLARQTNAQVLEHAQKMHTESKRGERKLSFQRQRTLDHRLNAESVHEREITQRLKERAEIDDGRIRQYKTLIAAQTAAAKALQQAGDTAAVGSRPAITWRAEESPD